MDLSDDGLAFLVRWEGRRNRAYNDALGHCTVGVGHLLHNGRCTDDELARVWTDDEVDELFRTDVARFIEAVNRYVTVPLTQRQFDALVSFAFNWGVGAASGFPATSVLRLVNAGDFAAAAADLVDGRGPNSRRYDKALPGVRARRIAEAAWLRGDPRVKVITRDEAGLRPSRGSSPLNVSIATAHYGGDGPGELDHDDCAAIWRSWQAQHMDTDQLAAGGANDIAYNLGACQHGWVLMGRGPGVKSAANGTGAANGASYAIVYIGGASAPFTDEAKHAFLDAAGLLGASLSKGHRDWVSTSCPGDAIYEWVHAGAPRPDGSNEEDFMANVSQEQVDALLERVERIDANTNDFGEHIFGPLGAGSWEQGAQRVGQAVRLIEEICHKGGGSVSLTDDDLNALAAKVSVSLTPLVAEAVANVLGERLSRPPE